MNKHPKEIDEQNYIAQCVVEVSFADQRKQVLNGIKKAFVLFFDCNLWVWPRNAFEIVENFSSLICTGHLL